MRQSGGGSVTLARLAEEGQTTVPRPVLEPRERTTRLALAAGLPVSPTDGGIILYAMVGWLFTIAVCFESVGLAGLLAVASAWITAAAVKSAGGTKAHRDGVVKAMLAEPQGLPFPVTGFEDWLVSDIPIVDITLADTVERKLFVEAVRTIDRGIEVEVLGDRRFRLSMPPRVHVSPGVAPVERRYGDRELWKRLIDRMLRPLHDEIGVVSVHAGGTVGPRALAGAAPAPLALPPGSAGR
jgi:hypothetical protein